MSFYCYVIFHCVATLHLIYSPVSWWTVALFPLWGSYKWCFCKHLCTSFCVCVCDCVFSWKLSFWARSSHLCSFGCSALWTAEPRDCSPAHVLPHLPSGNPGRIPGEEPGVYPAGFLRWPWHLALPVCHCPIFLILGEFIIPFFVNFFSLESCAPFSLPLFLTPCFIFLS